MNTHVVGFLVLMGWWGATLSLGHAQAVRLDTAALLSQALDEGATSSQRLAAFRTLTHAQGLMAWPDSSLAYAQRYVDLARRSGIDSTLIAALTAQADLLGQLKQHEAARAAYQAVLALQRRRADRLGQAHTLMKIGSLYRRQAAWSAALRHLFEGLTLAETLADLKLQSSLNLSIGLVYRSQGLLKESIAYFDSSLSLARRLDAGGQLSTLYNHIAIAHLMQRKMDSALHYFRLALADQEAHHSPSLVTSLMNLGGLLVQVGQPAQGLSYLKRAYEVLAAQHNLDAAGDVLHNIGATYQIMGQHAEALRYEKQALALAQQLDDLEMLEQIYTGLADSYRATGQYRQAYEMQRRLMNTRDSLRTDAKAADLLRQQAQYAYAKQALQDSLAYVRQEAETRLRYQQQLSQRNYLIGTLTVLGLLIAGGWWYRQGQQNRKRALKLAQERARQKRLEEMDALKNRFFTNITHEFRTPLTVISGMAQVLRGNRREKKLILRNSENLLRLINQLLDLAKLEEGKLELHLVQVDMVSYVRHLTESFYSMAEEKEVRLTFYAEERAIWMDIDEEKIQYIVFNLLSNALKFTLVGGKVVLHLKRLDHRLEINVQDNGVGIAPEQLPYIFDRFYQADDSSTRSYEGTGIGLAYTRELVHLLGGEIEVDSEPAVGTTFRLWLPIAQQAPPSVPQMAASQPTPIDQTSFAPEAWDSEAQPQVLIVEDNPDLVFYLQSVLVNHYALKIARNGAEGITMALEMVPDLIISDVIMPQQDGFELCETLKTDQRTSHIPIILLTAKAAQADKVKGLTQGADGYMAKPFDKEELLVRVKKLIALRRSLQLTYAREAAKADPATEQLPAPEHAFLQQLRAGLTPVLDDADFTIPQVADLMGMSQIQVYRKLKALTGQTPSQFLRQMRLDASKALLGDPEKTIAEIAYEVGFSDPNYFSKTFHQAFGIPPSEFRKRL